MEFKETELGFVGSDDRSLVFFGNYLSDLNSLRKKFPLLDFSSVKQVHGDVLVESRAAALDWSVADAHYSQTKNLGLIIKTADCLPILALHREKSLVMAIHAGWRGVANQITKKSFHNLSEAARPQGWQIFIGPHIQSPSFLVQQDCLNQLAQHHKIAQDLWSHKTSDGWLVNLRTLILEQLRDVSIQSSQVSWLGYDTKTDLRFHSYRRDRDRAGRQMSFIAHL